MQENYICFVCNKGILNTESHTKVKFDKTIFGYSHGRYAFHFGCYSLERECIERGLTSVELVE